MTNTTPGTTRDEDYPGRSLGLPADGRGALASWGQRITALVLDWAVAMLVASLITWGAVLSSTGPEKFATLIVFFVEKALLTGLTGSSLGQLIVRIGVTRTDGQPISFWVAIVRTLMICVVIPAVVIGADRRSLNDMLLHTMVVKRR
ncbi:RDD family protein [Raineyella sp. LH-20]|uniref:RDD family protein n=1 Tax=Raineyella sp. LH-20 TaxID=3081204 RepID=UPI0029549142|nr:RDD family protein [Raineyella sp. LH-20]WOP17590.1 RDD family protein [Raineyella sp. LH-20]